MGKGFSVLLTILAVIVGIALFVLICWAALWVGQWLYGVFGLGGVLMLCTVIMAVYVLPPTRDIKKGR